LNEKISVAGIYFISMQSFAQDAPKLDFFCELKVKLDPALVVGETAHGIRRIIPIIGGSVEGPKIKGEIISGGADWQVLRKDGVMELEAPSGKYDWINNSLFVFTGERLPDAVLIRVRKVL
jgi:hypothetical protein